MEPQQYHYKQQTQYFHFEKNTNYSGDFQEVGTKISTRKGKFYIILNSIFHLIFIALSFLYSMTGPSPDYGTTTVMYVNVFPINLFFAIVLWIPRRNIPGGRKTLYSCLIFVATIVFFYACLFVFMANNVGILLLAWPILILFTVMLYYFIKYVQVE